MKKILLVVLALSPFAAFSGEPTKLECSARYEIRTRAGGLTWTAPEALSTSEIRYGGAIARGTLSGGETYLAELNLAIDDHHDHEYNTEFYMQIKKDARTTWSAGGAPRVGAEAQLSIPSEGTTRDGDAIQAVQVSCALR